MRKYWLALFLLVIVPMVLAINKPIFENPILSYKNLSYNLSWVPSDNATYQLVFNNAQVFSGSTNSYLFLLNNFSSGNFSLFVNVTDLNGSDYNLGWLFFTTNTPPTKPGLAAFAQVDISLGPIVFNITASTDVNLDPVMYLLYANDVSLANFTGVQYNLTSFSEGNFSFKVCASDGYAQTCSDPVAVSISNGTIPQINSVSYGYGIPFYGDIQVRVISINVSVTDLRENQVNTSIYASNSDYYDEDDNMTRYATCSKIADIGGMKTYNCSVQISYLMQPGFYDVHIYAFNGLKSADKVFQEKVGIGTLLSYGTSSPMFDFDNTYSDWTYTNPVANITNLGNVPYSDVGLELKNMTCPHNYDYPLASFRFSKRDNRGSAFLAENGFQWLDLAISRGISHDLYFFLSNPDETIPDHPTECDARWSLKVNHHTLNSD